MRSRFMILTEWLTGYDHDVGCTATWIEAEYFKLNRWTPKPTAFTRNTSEVCDAMTDCEDCPYLSPNRVREIMRRISDGTTDANPSGPF